VLEVSADFQWAFSARASDQLLTFSFMAMRAETTALEAEPNSLWAPRAISSETFLPAKAFLTTSPTLAQGAFVFQTDGGGIQAAIVHAKTKQWLKYEMIRTSLQGGCLNKRLKFSWIRCAACPPPCVLRLSR